jgi:hypothetical protein
MMMIENIRKKIIELCYYYEGQEEIKGNAGFKDDIFQQKIEAVGWNTGQAWCSYFAELIWKEAYGHFDSTVINKLDKLFSANAVKTFENFKNSKDFKTATNQNLEPGDLVIWSYYKNNEPKKVDIWTLGHIGIVTQVAQLFFLSMEGNTNSQGGREGIEVAEKKRSYSFYKENGLRLLGFVKPKNI